MTREPVLEGGCQCGSVRYALYTRPKTSLFCHCRMCQRASGGVFAPWTTVEREDFAWTKGRPATFASSDIAERGFCRRCGTPLSLIYQDDIDVSVMTGTLDEPEKAPIDHHYGVESQVSWLKLCDGLPGRATWEDPVFADRYATMTVNQGQEAPDGNGGEA